MSLEKTVKVNINVSRKETASNSLCQESAWSNQLVMLAEDTVKLNIYGSRRHSENKSSC